MILGQYPWIEDFEVKVWTFGPALGGSKKISFQDFAVVYSVNPDKDGAFTVTDEFAKVEDLTETLFKMIGPEHYQRFKGVEFVVEEK